MAHLHRSAVLVAAAAAVTAGIAGAAIFTIPGEPPATYRAVADAAQIVGIAAGTALVVAALAAFTVTRRAGGSPRPRAA